MTRVTFNTGTMEDGLSFGYDRQPSYFQVRIGKYIVELVDGQLVVRPLTQNIGAGEILRVPADG